MIKILYLFAIFILMAGKGFGEYMLICNKESLSVAESILIILSVAISILLIAFLLFVALMCSSDDNE